MLVRFYYTATLLICTIHAVFRNLHQLRAAAVGGSQCVIAEKHKTFFSNLHKM